ncbi:MAG: hypothetical protein V1659_00280 [Candidatus Woesearchaeota archaeon]
MINMFLEVTESEVDAASKVLTGVTAKEYIESTGVIVTEFQYVGVHHLRHFESFADVTHGYSALFSSAPLGTKVVIAAPPVAVGSDLIFSGTALVRKDRSIADKANSSGSGIEEVPERPRLQPNRG